MPVGPDGQRWTWRCISGSVITDCHAYMGPVCGSGHSLISLNDIDDGVTRRDFTSEETQIDLDDNPESGNNPEPDNTPRGIDNSRVHQYVPEPNI
jgi:hypothetical protein